MRRLIDADALMKAMYHRAFETDGDTMWQSGCWVRYRAIEQVVKDQPTIEERKTGKWIISNTNRKVTTYECSECGRVVFDDTGYDVSKDYPYCHCGADMRGQRE